MPGSAVAANDRGWAANPAQADTAERAPAADSNELIRTRPSVEPSSDPVNMAQIMVEAIRHPGFSLVQVLSPCVTFRPEQAAWRGIPFPDLVERLLEWARCDM